MAIKLKFNKKEIGVQWMERYIQTLQQNHGLNVSYKNNEVLFGKELAQGNCFYYELEPGLELVFMKMSFSSNILLERKATGKPAYYTLQIDYGNKPFNKVEEGTQSDVCWRSSDSPLHLNIEKNCTWETVWINVSANYLRQFNVSLAQTGSSRYYNQYDQMNIKEFYKLRELLQTRIDNRIQHLKLSGIVLCLLARFIVVMESFQLPLDQSVNI